MCLGSILFGSFNIRGCWFLISSAFFCCCWFVFCNFFRFLWQNIVENLSRYGDICLEIYQIAFSNRNSLWQHRVYGRYGGTRHSLIDDVSSVHILHPSSDIWKKDICWYSFNIILVEKQIISTSFCSSPFVFFSSWTLFHFIGLFCLFFSPCSLKQWSLRALSSGHVIALLSRYVVILHRVTRIFKKQTSGSMRPSSARQTLVSLVVVITVQDIISTSTLLGPAEEHWAATRPGFVLLQLESSFVLNSLRSCWNFWPQFVSPRKLEDHRLRGLFSDLFVK